MLLIASLLLVFGAVGVVVLNVDLTGPELQFGYQQMIHARIPWLLLGALGAGASLGVVSLVRKRAWYKYPIVGVELLVFGLLAFYFGSLSFLPEHALAVDVGDPFPSYSLPDHTGELRTALAGEERTPALYIFYRGDW